MMHTAGSRAGSRAMKLLSLIMGALLLGLGACSSEPVPTLDKVAIQDAMNQYIEGKLAGESTYAIGSEVASFDYLHDGVKDKDGFFVSCADFKVGEDTLDVDYYVKEANGVYTVVKEVLHKRDGAAVDKVLWEAP